MVFFGLVQRLLTQRSEHLKYKERSASISLPLFHMSFQSSSFVILKSKVY